MTRHKFTTTQTDLKHHSGQFCEFVRPLIIGEEVDPECAPMYRVRFNDGAEIDVFPDELVPLVSEVAGEWSGHPDPSDPDNFWIDDATGERVNAATGERESQS